MGGTVMARIFDLLLRIYISATKGDLKRYLPPNEENMSRIGVSPIYSLDPEPTAPLKDTIQILVGPCVI